MRGLPTQGICTTPEIHFPGYAFLLTRLPVRGHGPWLLVGLRSLYGCGTAGVSHPFPLLHSLTYTYPSKILFLNSLITSFRLL